MYWAGETIVGNAVFTAETIRSTPGILLDRSL